MKKSFYFFVFLAFISCGMQKNIPVKKITEIDFAHQFILQLIDNKILNSNWSLEMGPKKIDYSEIKEHFSQKKSVYYLSENSIITAPNITLTKIQIESLKPQTKKKNKFNNSFLNFNQKSDDYYRLSYPVFTKNKKYVFLKIYHRSRTWLGGNHSLSLFILNKNGKYQEVNLKYISKAVR